MASFLLSGCTGIITGHEYKKEDLVIVYKVIKNGVTTFMTPEEIREAELDKVDMFITDSYKLLTPQEREAERAEKAEKAKKAEEANKAIEVNGAERTNRTDITDRTDITEEVEKAQEAQEAHSKISK